MNKPGLMVIALLLVISFSLPALSAGQTADWVVIPDEQAQALEQSGQTVIPPVKPVPQHVIWLLEIARAELGYTEGRNNATKYGTWAGDPNANWCAEYVCWCVDQVDQKYGTQLLTFVYPRYSSKNVGRNWFIKEGRYISRRGTIPDYGSQWLTGHTEPIGKNGYIPQPGDWMFFSQSADGDTSHVAMVEFCTKDSAGQVRVYALEGNKPDKVQETAYLLEEETIQGYGTVFDLADVVLKMGCESKKVSALQALLNQIGLLDSAYMTGIYGSHTTEAVRLYQRAHGIEVTGVAGHETQLSLQAYIQQYRLEHPEYWEVLEDD